MVQLSQCFSWKQPLCKHFFYLDCFFEEQSNQILPPLMSAFINGMVHIIGCRHSMGHSRYRQNAS